METTINMHLVTFKRLSKASELCGVSRSELIMKLVKEMMNSTPDNRSLGKMVQYQERCEPDCWRRFHLQVRMDEYDYMLDLRKFFKMSVSLIIAFAVRKYLNKIIKNINTDNYPFKNYVIIREIVDTIICWRIFWGYPRNMTHHLPSPPIKPLLIKKLDICIGHDRKSQWEESE